MAINTYVLPCLLTDLPRVSLKFGSTLDPANIKENDDVYFECEIEAKPRVHKIEWKFEVTYAAMHKKNFLSPANTLPFEYY